MIYHKKSWQYLSVTIEDAVLLERALREAFPSLRILRWDIRHKWDETWRWRPIYFEHNEHNPKFRDKPWKMPSSMRDPTGEPLLYRNSLGYPHDRYFVCWVEPEGWEPVWEKSRPDDWRYHLVNMPSKNFEFRRSTFKTWPMSGGLSRVEYNGGTVDQKRPPRETWDDEIVVMSAGALWTSWEKDDAETKSFCHKVFRIAQKILVNEFRAVDPETLKPYRREPMTGAHYWAGPHAIKWAGERRHNYLCGYEKPADYDFGPDEPDG